MRQIKMLRVDHTIVYAAEELKKYFRMMMPDGGDVAISFEPDAKDGYRLGLLEDFGLDTSEVEDPVLDAVHDLAEEERVLAAKQPHPKPTRPQTVSWRLLELHAEYCDYFCEVMKAKAAGQNFKAAALAQKFADEFGKHEFEIERYYDHYLMTNTFQQINAKMQGTNFY